MDKSMRPVSICSTPGMMASGGAAVSAQTSVFPVLSRSESSNPTGPSSAKRNSPRTSRIQASKAPEACPSVEGVFNVNNEGAFREELEIGVVSINGLPFRGSLTRQEAKLEIYKKCLGFADYSNFDGVRLGYRGGPIIVFKLKNAINVDELYHIQNFTYNRKTTRQGAAHVDVINCQIKGLRDPSRVSETRPKFEDQYADDGTRLVKIEGCEYRVSREVLTEYLSHYGTLASEILEDVFEDNLGPDESDDGTNRTGNYSVRIKLNKDMPQLAPIMGKRVKFYYRGIQKLCTNCFGHHNRQVCQSRRVTWINYVTHFIDANPHFHRILYGRWFDIVKKGESLTGGNQDNQRGINETNSGSRPAKNAPPPKSVTNEVATAEWLKRSTPEAGPSRPTFALPCEEDSNLAKNQEPNSADYLIPATPEEHKTMVDKLILGGSLRDEAEQTIQNRKLAFNKAYKNYKKSAPQNRATYKKKGNNPVRTSINASVTNPNHGI